MTKQEYFKKQREILLKLAEGITWQPYTELSEKKEYFTLEEASEALYQLHLEGVREAYEKGLRDMADDDTIADKAIAKFGTGGKA